MPFEQPKKIKLYLHPPAAGAMISVWPDFKIVHKPVRADPARQNDGFGLRFLFGNPASMPDWTQSPFRTRPDGIPAPGITTRIARCLRRWNDIICARARYGMSPEFYIQERYADNDPTFCSWQPNASANGRLIMMLLDFFGEIES